MFIRFDEDDCVCCCSINNKKCDNECTEYIAKLTEIKRDNSTDDIKKALRGITNSCSRLESEVSKVVRKFNNINSRIIRR